MFCFLLHLYEIGWFFTGHRVELVQLQTKRGENDATKFGETVRYIVN